MSSHVHCTIAVSPFHWTFSNHNLSLTVSRLPNPQCYEFTYILKGSVGSEP